MSFSGIPERSNGKAAVNRVDASWWNLLKAAGVLLETSGTWSKYSFTYDEFSTAGLTNDVEITSLAAKGIVEQAVIKSTTLFAGSGITDLSASLGVTGSLDLYLPSYDLLAAVGDTNFQQAIVDQLHNFGSATSIRIQLTAVGANLDQLSAGGVDVYLKTKVLP